MQKASAEAGELRAKGDAKRREAEAAAAEAEGLKDQIKDLEKRLSQVCTGGVGLGQGGLCV